MMNSARLAFKHGIILLLFSFGGGACFQTPTISEYIYDTTLLFFFFGENSAIADIFTQFAVNANDDSGYIRVIITGTPFMALVQVVERG